MPRLLLDRTTGALLPYPRQDNEPVAGLDRTAAYVVEVVRETAPEYDPATHYLQPLEPVVAITDPDSDDVNGSATYGWELVPIPEPAPVPDWPRFKRIAMASDTLNSILAGAYGVAPVAAGALAPALLQAETGAVADFAAAWAAIVKAVAVPPEVVAGFVGVATACHLPAAFVAALQPSAE
jgi:hypothetical protein